MYVVVVGGRTAEAVKRHGRLNVLLDGGMHEQCGATFFVECDEVAALRRHVLKAVDELVASEACVARLHSQRLAQFAESEQAPHNAGPAEDLLGDVGRAALADAPQYALIHLTQAIWKRQYHAADVAVAPLLADLLDLERYPKKPAVYEKNSAAIRDAFLIPIFHCYCWERQSGDDVHAISTRN